MKYYAHRSKDGTRWEPLEDHLRDTAEYATEFAGEFGMAQMVELPALMHDFGKISDAFQRRLNGSSERFEHSLLGAQIAQKDFERSEFLWHIAAYCVAGHHAGLPDYGLKSASAQERGLINRLMRESKGLDAIARREFAWLPEKEREFVEAARRVGDMMLPGQQEFSYAMLIRMLFSCIVDADYLATERFMSGGSVMRPRGQDISRLIARLEECVGKFGAPEPGSLNELRSEILESCRAGAKNGRGLFTLTVPTGGGKTLASLMFALRHAQTHGMSRVIYVIPYTSIIDQTARVFREAIGAENVLEVHSNIAFDDRSDNDTDSRRLASENFDAPVVVTTNVQFFESLFANRPSRCRKLHNFANSVLIFDEAQMLPLNLLKPCVSSIALLVRSYRCSAVLCTATQPSLKRFFPEDMKESVAELCPRRDFMFEAFRRVNYIKMGRVSLEELAGRLRECERALCVVNTRRLAHDLFDALKDDEAGEGVFHLSTDMPPVDRERILDEIRRRLDVGERCVTISTSLIEAGVDVDFPVVLREEAGLDSIVQAAGRCNREGRLPGGRGDVRIFAMNDEYFMPRSLIQPLEVGRSVLASAEDPSLPDSVKKYFNTLYSRLGDKLDSLCIKGARTSLAKLHAEYRLKVPFETIADAVRVIDTATASVLLPQCGIDDYELSRMTDEERSSPNRKLSKRELSDLADRIKDGYVTRDEMRRAGRYCVNIYHGELKKLLANGQAHMTAEDMYVLDDEHCYSDRSGLSVAQMGQADFW